MKKNNKDIKMLKNKLWTRRVSTEADIAMLRKDHVIEENSKE